MKTLTAVIFAFLFGAMPSQREFNAVTTQSSVKILGSSSIHEWESEVEDFVATGLKTDDRIQNLSVIVPVKSIKSGKSIMDDKTYEALMADKFPKITLTASELTIINGQAKGEGKLSIAGKVKTIPISAEIVPDATSMLVKGKVQMKMTDFGIDPPTAMFGTLTTADDVTILYEIKLNLK